MKQYLSTVFLVCFLLFSSCSRKESEEKLRMINIDGLEIIKPDIESVVYLFELPVKEWKKLIESKGFEAGGEEMMLIYTKTNREKKMLVQGLNKSAEEFGITWTNFDSGSLIMGEIEVELKEYFVEKDDMVNYYKYSKDGNDYIFTLSRDKNMGIEVLSVQKLVKNEI
ncbi:MAG: hypothetical protein JXR58_01695 [Bacteroidales bacterium]|nr:hypothetical protein [Bacteroidales bacterium]